MPSQQKIKKILNDRRKGLYITEDTLDESKLSLNQMEKDDVCYTLQHHSGMFGVLNQKELLLQLKLWKELKVSCMDFNHREIDVGDKKAWMWIIQPPNMDEDTPISPLAIAHGVMVSGFAYISKDKNIGELVIRHLTKQ